MRVLGQLTKQLLQAEQVLAQVLAVELTWLLQEGGHFLLSFEDLLDELEELHVFIFSIGLVKEGSISALDNKLDQVLCRTSSLDQVEDGTANSTVLPIQSSLLLHVHE